MIIKCYWKNIQLSKTLSMDLLKTNWLVRLPCSWICFDIILNFIRLESQRKSSTSQVVFFPTQSYKSLTESILNSKMGKFCLMGLPIIL